MNEKFIRKYMRLAKQFGEDSNPCLSRHIGSIIVNPESNRIISTGYNGPPRGTLHCDRYDFLHDFVWPQLTKEEKTIALAPEGYNGDNDEGCSKSFSAKYDGCGTCPRKLVGAPSGQRLNLCSCAHSEANALTACNESPYGAWLFCWCPLPCVECTKLIINAGIAKVICLTGDYSFGSRIMFNQRKIEIVQREPEEYTNE